MDPRTIKDEAGAIVARYDTDFTATLGEHCQELDWLARHCIGDDPIPELVERKREVLRGICLIRQQLGEAQWK